MHTYLNKAIFFTRLLLFRIKEQEGVVYGTSDVNFLTLATTHFICVPFRTP